MEHINGWKEADLIYSLPKGRMEKETIAGWGGYGSTGNSLDDCRWQGGKRSIRTKRRKLITGSRELLIMQVLTPATQWCASTDFPGVLLLQRNFGFGLYCPFWNAIVFFFKSCLSKICKSQTMAEQRKLLPGTISQSLLRTFH